VMTEPIDDTPDEHVISGYVAYFEPLRPPDDLTAEAEELIEKAATAEPQLAESLQRTALERLVDAFLVDRDGHAECFSAAHLLGREILERFGCPFTFDAERKVWILRCGVLALHSRLGTSPGVPRSGSVRSAARPTSSAITSTARSTTESAATESSHVST
jgi:hypothetical protein